MEDVECASASGGNLQQHEEDIPKPLNQELHRFDAIRLMCCPQRPDLRGLQRGLMVFKFRKKT